MSNLHTRADNCDNSTVMQIDLELCFWLWQWPWISKLTSEFLTPKNLGNHVFWDDICIRELVLWHSLSLWWPYLISANRSKGRDLILFAMLFEMLSPIPITIPSCITLSRFAPFSLFNHLSSEFIYHIKDFLQKSRFLTLWWFWVIPKTEA